MVVPELPIMRLFRHTFFMKGKRDSLIEEIQSSGHKAALLVTGGGSGALHALLTHPGASRLILEAQIPYSPSAMQDYLGEKLDGFCSENAAKTMAERAYERAMIFTLPQGLGQPILGIACTAALQTNRERKGADRAFFCIKSRKREVVRTLELDHGSRAEQEDAVSAALLDFIAEFLGVEP
jgi:nicotinamide mononucleotide (NMN) deamidase PncC